MRGRSQGSERGQRDQGSAGPRGGAGDDGGEPPERLVPGGGAMDPGHSVDWIRDHPPDGESGHPGGDGVPQLVDEHKAPMSTVAKTRKEDGATVGLNAQTMRSAAEIG